MSSHLNSAKNENVRLLTLHVGQTNPLMFSITPSTGIPVLRQKVSSFLTSSMATACGVVTKMAPSQFRLLIVNKNLHLSDRLHSMTNVVFYELLIIQKKFFRNLLLQFRIYMYGLKSTATPYMSLNYELCIFNINEKLLNCSRNPLLLWNLEVNYYSQKHVTGLSPEPT